MAAVKYSRHHRPTICEAILSKYLITLVPILFLAVTNRAAQASELDLKRFFADIQTLSAEFSQRVEDESGTTLERSSGKFYLSRPGKFRWDYQNPDFEDEPGQQIVADGRSLYFYDPDLEQVSQRSLGDALGQVPSLLLVQQGADIEKHFSVMDFGLTDGLSWVALKPKDVDAGYQQLMIAFEQGVINTLQLYDGLGNTTRLELSNVHSNPEIASSQFEFAVPEGADVLTQ